MPCVIELRVVSLPATDEHDHEEAELVVGELLPLDVSLDQRRDDVLGRVLVALLGHLHRVHDQFHRRLRGIDVGVLGILATGHLVGPTEDLVAVLLRHAEQAGDGLQRKLTRHLLDEVAACPRRRGALGDVLRALASSSSSRPMARGRETAGDDLAQPGVVRRVHVEHHVALQVRSARAVISCGQTGMAPFCQLEKTSLRYDTSLTSSCLVTSQ